MAGETVLAKLLQQIQPLLNDGAYVFCSVNQDAEKYLPHATSWFRETEGITLILGKQKADDLQLSYEQIFSWITLTVHSSLEAVGLTAAFSNALSDAGISCNVMAAFYHDHIFVPQKDALKAMQVLQNFGQANKDI